MLVNEKKIKIHQKGWGFQEVKICMWLTRKSTTELMKKIRYKIASWWMEKSIYYTNIWKGYSSPIVCILYLAWKGPLYGKNCSRRNLTRRRHDIGNSLGDETSCESNTQLTYSTLIVLAPNGQWFLRKTPLKFYAHLTYY